MNNKFPIIEKLGGYKSTFKKLRAKGYKAKTPDAIRMWSNRNRANIPGIATRLLMQIAKDEGLELILEDFEFPKQNKPKPQR